MASLGTFLFRKLKYERVKQAFYYECYSECNDLFIIYNIFPNIIMVNTTHSLLMFGPPLLGV